MSVSGRPSVSSVVVSSAVTTEVAALSLDDLPEEPQDVRITGEITRAQMRIAGIKRLTGFILAPPFIDLVLRVYYLSCLYAD